MNENFKTNYEARLADQCYAIFGLIQRIIADFKASEIEYTLDMIVDELKNPVSLNLNMNPPRQLLRSICILYFESKARTGDENLNEIPIIIFPDLKTSAESQSHSESDFTQSVAE